MVVRYRPYKESDRWYIDVDPDDELNYVAIVRQWCVDNATSVASFEIVPKGVEVLIKGVMQGEFNSLLPAKLKVTFASGAEAYATFRSITADGQKFDKTIWFKKVDH